MKILCVDVWNKRRKAVLWHVPNEVNEAAQNRMELIVPQSAKQYGVTEQLKAKTKWNGYDRLKHGQKPL